MAAPNKQRYPAILGQGGPASKQLSHPNRFCQRCPLLCYNGYSQIRCSIQNQVVLRASRIEILISCRCRLKKIIYYNLVPVVTCLNRKKAEKMAPRYAECQKIQNMKKLVQGKKLFKKNLEFLLFFVSNYAKILNGNGWIL